MINRQTILVVDDCDFNRELLTEILGDKYEIMEAENGVEAVDMIETHYDEISLILLDIVMPQMDGFEVLETMNLLGWIDSIPVIMISAEDSSDFVHRAYAGNVTDFISRPFDCDIVQHRVYNTLALYAKQHELEEMVAEQIDKREKGNKLMITILSQIVEFRNGESGSHIVNIRSITKLLLKRVNIVMGNIYSEEDISRICTASALHDIGKITVPEDILNKADRLTDVEFEIMKHHSMAGAEILKGIMADYDDPLLKTAYEICRWHHERYDGSGYPDGLVGNSIPIPAQVVAVADVYDALTSERCYKKAYPHEIAVDMILKGQCGAFSPLILTCLQDIDSDLMARYRAKQGG